MRAASICFAVAILSLPVLAQDEDFTGKVLALAKKDHAKAVEKARSGLLDDLKQKAEAVQKAGNLNALESIQKEIKAFEENGTLPKSVPTKSYETQMKAARAKLDEAYAVAVKQYTKDGKIELAKQARQEAAGTLAPAPDDTADFIKASNWEGRGDIWKLEKGTIICETREDPKMNTFLCSKEKYGDFELAFKVRLKGEYGNTGVQIRSEVFDAKLFKVKGPQFDIGKGYWGCLYGENIGGMMKASDPKLMEKVVKKADFNDCVVVAKGTRITLKINGETMVDDDFPVLPGKDNRTLPTDGIIAFQAHGGYPGMRVEFKDIKFKKLK